MAEKQYLDVNVEDFSEELQALALDNRAAYERQRTITRAMVAQLNQEVTLPPGREIVGIVWTRWGQMQAIEADKPLPKAQAKQRGNLADYRAAQEAEGRSH